ncbi:dGTP triphosphohydrolase [Bacillus toyonensis]|uniref:dGTP triphosphohydrolase n=1 Tax=Bacillus toyonensis TaxID=155322 RepID=UPI000AF5B8AD|nr:dNTP triphosphohydrolase [Bacillus toyonensis]
MVIGGKKLKDFWEVKELASLVEVSCLVHDLGNPPFGHYGEDIIRNWFDNWFKSEKFKDIEKKYLSRGFSELTTQQKNDFRYFEGNAQAIRILTKLQFLNDRFGANFTYGTLATLMKYPWASDNAKAISKKKFGYFSSEQDLFEVLCKEVGIGDRRHPATYLLEAADDIAYLTADVEDGVKKGIVKWEEEYNNISNYLESEYNEDFNRLKFYREEAKKNKVPNKDLVNVQNFKIAAQGIMIRAVIDVFKNRYEDIMSGTFQGGLLEASTAKGLKKELTKISINCCYNNPEVLTLELVGDRVIGELLNLFVDAVVDIHEEPKTKSKKEKLFHLISENFRHIQSIDNNGLPSIKFEELSLYDRLLLITDFISGMTDSYAVSLHQKLLGVKLP